MHTHTHTGIHMQTIPGGYMCECPEAYSGQNCEQFDACFSSPCDNDGTCNRVPVSHCFNGRLVQFNE